MCRVSHQVSPLSLSLFASLHLSLLRIHHGVLTSSHQYLSIVEQLRTRCLSAIEQLRVSVGRRRRGDDLRRLEHRGIQLGGSEVDSSGNRRAERCETVRRCSREDLGE